MAHPDGVLDEVAFPRQVACAEFLDARTGELLDLVTSRGRPTTVVVCADHGGALGEDGLYGHAMYHPKVMEVPLLIFPPERPSASNAGAVSCAKPPRVSVVVPRDALTFPVD